MPSLKQIFVLAAPFMGLIQQVAANPDIDESSDLIARDDFDSDIYVRGAGNGVIKRPGPGPRPPTIVVTPPQRRPRSLDPRGAGNGVIKRPGPGPRPPTIVVTPPQRRPRSLNRRGAGNGVIKRPGPGPRPPTIVVTPPQRRPGHR